VRKPGLNFAEGVTTAGLGKPDYVKALEQHAAYCDALKRCGLSITILEPDIQYPDGCFVEDTAIITEHGAILTQPGHPARIGEQNAIEQHLLQHMPVQRISGAGTVDGGDILRMQQHFYIGRSDRTNSEGARQLADMLSAYGYTTSEVNVPSGLHLKSSATYLGNNTVVTTKSYAHCFDAGTILDVEDEEYAANCVRLNDYVLVPKGFPKTKDKLEHAGFRLIELDMTEFRKMDGGLTCLSLLF
jgi:dimethylargininase